MLFVCLFRTENTRLTVIECAMHFLWSYAKSKRKLVSSTSLSPSLISVSSYFCVDFWVIYHLWKDLSPPFLPFLDCVQSFMLKLYSQTIENHCELLRWIFWLLKCLSQTQHSFWLIINVIVPFGIVFFSLRFLWLASFSSLSEQWFLALSGHLTIPAWLMFRSFLQLDNGGCEFGL